MLEGRFYYFFVCTLYTQVTRSGIQFADLKNGVITALRNSG